MIRTRICLYVLLLTPLVVYWQTIFHDFGLHDDYALLNAVRESPGQVVKACSSQGRPLTGALLETSLAVTDDVSQLPWLRLTTVSLLTLLGLALWRQLYQSGWTEVEAATIGLGVILLPAAQITAGWASRWPDALALLLAVAGFSAIEAELERGGLKRFVALLGGALIYALATLVIPANVFFAVVPITAVLLVRSGREPLSEGKWLGFHLGALLAGVAASLLLLQTLRGSGVFTEATGLQWEANPIAKIGWFFTQSLPDALALFAMREAAGFGAVIFWSAALGSGLIIAAGFWSKTRDKAAVKSRKWVWCVVILPVLAHGVGLVTAERSAAYGLLFPLSGLVIVLVLHSLRVLTTARGISPLLHYIALGLLAAGAALVASRNTFVHVAAPQGRDWDLVKSMVLRANFTKPTSVFVITPAAGQAAERHPYGDNTGLLPGGSDLWTVEMLKAALHERFGKKLPKGGSYTVETGHERPDNKTYDVVIDLRL
jgi:hypothetical protein